MITHFLAADGRFGKPLSQPPYPRTLELKHFRYDSLAKNFLTFLPFKKPNTKKTIKLRKIMPMKPVQLPPSHF